MNAGNLKGALLEFCIRNILYNCGFHKINPDGMFIYERSGLCFINGKGASHDADVLMEPPIQLPFSNPSRIIFECKAYEKKTGLAIIRNALGLRYDINEFEIVTEQSIIARKNNRRASYAISNRIRYNYQVGVACVDSFSKPAIEFAANNKIHLLSLKWILPENCIEKFHEIDKNYVTTIGDSNCENIYKYFKDRDINSKSKSEHQNTIQFLSTDNKIGLITKTFNSLIQQCFIGLLETGDLIFLFAETNQSIDELIKRNPYNKGLKTQIHYYQNQPDIWELTIAEDFLQTSNIPKFKFYIPDSILNNWKQHNRDKKHATSLKEQYFSKIYIFTNLIKKDLPFFILKIDTDWLDQIK